MVGTRARQLVQLIAALALLILALAGCGSDSGSTASQPTAVPATTAGGSAGSAGQPGATATTASAGQPSATATTGSGAAVATATTVAPTPTGGAAAPSAAATTGATQAPVPTAVTATTAAAPATAERYAIVPDASKATYRVRETFVGRGLNVAVGSTGAFTGDIFINRQKPSDSRVGTITVDISKLTSDSRQRDGAIRNDWLDSSQYPTATFVPKRLEGLPDTPYTEGQELTFKIVGDLTVRNVTKEVTFDAKGKIVGDTFTGTATTQFNMTDFGFDPPDIAGVLKAENGVQLELTIEAKRQ